MMDVEIIDDTPDNQSNGNSTAATQSVMDSDQEKLISEALANVSWPSNIRRTRHREHAQALKLGLTSATDKFLHNFNPENSNRERRKLTRKLVQNNKRAYDAKGILLVCNKDLCDCLNEKCPGCFFPCPKCRSCKCGHECRQFRKWIYESAEIQGTKSVIQNPYKDLLKKNP
ncbi:unnamed protein product [Bemisia tabaci]|uniref:ARF7 effector protein C-terminal domain-containing protein n=1 Tax=Bemisia tabaci TaxID=7038 RepID=A0A9P0A8G8_BEMTA|nr:PREDICTED: ARL14 effector protein [Bemisia tabaci]CAH0386398.1 unnamed protein product [Bemisia tabaci]